jgi:hypothetical protein
MRPRWQHWQRQRNRRPERPIPERKRALARRRAEESFRSSEQEPRSYCRRHSEQVQPQERLKQVWSSSIDTPEI